MFDATKGLPTPPPLTLTLCLGDWKRTGGTESDSFWLTCFPSFPALRMGWVKRHEQSVQLLFACGPSKAGVNSDRDNTTRYHSRRRRCYRSVGFVPHPCTATMQRYPNSITSTTCSFMSRSLLLDTMPQLAPRVTKRICILRCRTSFPDHRAETRPRAHSRMLLRNSHTRMGSCPTSPSGRRCWR